MGFDRRFTVVSVVLVAALLATVTGAVLAFARADLGAVRLVALLAVAGVTALLLHHVERGNRTVARFVEALRHGDGAVRFPGRGGSSFRLLGETLTGAVRDVQAERRRGLEELRFREALVDDIPVGLLSVDGDGRITLLNKAGRRLFDRHTGVRAVDFATYGEGFAALLAAPAPRAPGFLTIDLAAGPSRALVGVGLIARLGAPLHVVAVEPVHDALEAVEVGTQGDVVRVLAHEILNSLTPVTSLAGTAAVLLGEEEPDIAEARLAVLTLARRAEGLRRFIDSYRAVARAPAPRRRRFEAAPFVAELARLFRVEWLETELVASVEPGAVIDADPDLLMQVLINLLRNAAQAAGERGHVSLDVRTRAGATVIEVEDDGPGIPQGMRQEVFLPFFTTRAGGTGVGLSLVRQIMVAHGWRIDVATGTMGGALLRLTGGQG